MQICSRTISQERSIVTAIIIELAHGRRQCGYVTPQLMQISLVAVPKVVKDIVKVGTNSNPPPFHFSGPLAYCLLTLPMAPSFSSFPSQNFISPCSFNLVSKGEILLSLQFAIVVYTISLPLR